MKKIICLLLLVFVTAMATSQQKKKYDHAKEINEELWSAFVEAYNERNAEKYLAVHTQDIVRITQGGIRQGLEFRSGIRKSFDRKDLPKREIEFKFEHRIHDREMAYEVGYFKVTYFRDGAEEDYYGRFSVLLKKEDGKWKIAQDWDVDKINGDPITASDYKKLNSIVIRD
jgi:ketosteroid isomerase-like protein